MGFRAPLTAQVIYSVVPIVFLVQKLSHVPDGIAVERLATAGWKGHGYDTVCDIRQVKVKMLVNVATLILRNL